MKEKAKAFDSDATKIRLLRRQDKVTLVLFAGMFVASLFLFWYIHTKMELSVYQSLPAMATPFFVIGLIYYFLNKRYLAVVFILALSVALFFVLRENVLFIVYLLICAEGVVQLVEIIQRVIFYPIMTAVEKVNIKKKMSITDRLVVFFFNIPVDLDTRSLIIDRDIKINKLPWKDMFYTMMLALLFCMFLWIYMFLNPSVSLGTTGVPIYTFTIILYLSAIVMPWTIFSTMDARISTEYRDFKLYSGFLNTFKRMFLPVFAALIFLLTALSSGPENLYYVGMSLIMIVAMIVFTSVMYFTSNVGTIVTDIMDKWEEFHPSEIYSRFGSKDSESSLDDGVPGTPRRDLGDCFVQELRNPGR